MQKNFIETRVTNKIEIRIYKFHDGFLTGSTEALFYDSLINIKEPCPPPLQKNTIRTFHDSEIHWASSTWPLKPLALKIYGTFLRISMKWYWKKRKSNNFAILVVKRILLYQQAYNLFFLNIRKENDSRILQPNFLIHLDRLPDHNSTMYFHKTLLRKGKRTFRCFTSSSYTK